MIGGPDLRMMFPSMFTAIYSFRAKSGKEQQLLDAWASITREFVRTRGSLGSRRHRNKDGKYVAIALWPDRAHWEAPSSSISPELEAARSAMHEACEEITTEHELDLVLDLWKAPGQRSTSL